MGYVALQHWSLANWRQAQWERMEEDLKSSQHLEGEETWVVADFADLDWENAHEIKRQGAIYDVLSIKLRSDGRWELRCLADTEESRMQADFLSLLRGQEQGEGAAQGPWVQRLLAANYIGLPTIKLHALIVAVQISHTSNWAVVPQAALAPDGPPPQPSAA